jgi:FtsH-binding integral membrane protein
MKKMTFSQTMLALVLLVLLVCLGYFLSEHISVRSSGFKLFVCFCYSVLACIVFFVFYSDLSRSRLNELARLDAASNKA